MITLIWHIYPNEFKGLQRLQDKSILLAPKSSTWGFETTIDGLLVFKEIEDNKTCEMKPIRDNLGEGRAPGSGPLLASIPGLCPSPSPHSLVNAAWPTSRLVVWQGLCPLASESLQTEARVLWRCLTERNIEHRSEHSLLCASSWGLEHAGLPSFRWWWNNLTRCLPVILKKGARLVKNIKISSLI